MAQACSRIQVCFRVVATAELQRIEPSGGGLTVPIVAAFFLAAWAPSGLDLLAVFGQRWLQQAAFEEAARAYFWRGLRFALPGVASCWGVATRVGLLCGRGAARVAEAAWDLSWSGGLLLDWQLRRCCRRRCEPPADCDVDAMIAGQFYAIAAPVARPDEWDEVYAVAPVGPGRWMCYTNDLNGAFCWADVRLVPGQVRGMVGVVAARTVGAGAPPVALASVSKVRNPGAGIWIPPAAAVLAQLTAEGTMLAGLLTGAPRADDPLILFLGGGAGAAPVAPAAVAAPIAAPAAPVVGGGGAGVLVPVAPAAGAPGAAPVAGALGPGVPPADVSGVKDLIAAVRADLEKLALEGRGRSSHSNKSSRSSKGSSRRSRRSSGSRGRRKHRKHDRSSSSSRSSRGHSRHHSHRYRNMPRWDRGKKRRSLSPGGIRNLQTIRVKNRAELIHFASRHRGCLAAQFLVAVHNALAKGDPKDTRELMHVDVTRWSQDCTGLKETRDLREVQNLCLVLQRLQAGRESEAADCIAQRIKSILTAKAPKGSWEKAQQIELLPVSGAAVATAAELSLTGLGG